MSETLQVIIVTAVAGLAFLFLLRPLLQKRRPPAKGGTCANCSMSHARGRRAPAGRAPNPGR